MVALVDQRIDNSLKYMNTKDFFEKDGAGEGTRTPDPIITNDVLYQLSYTGTRDVIRPK